MRVYAQTEIASLNGVTKNYGPHCALSTVDLSLESGKILALLGPNGAGKTTAVKLLLGLLKPSTGQVSVPKTLRVKEHIDLFSSYYPRPLKMADTIARAGLERLENRFYRDLSGGEQRRVLFALAICAIRICCSSTNQPPGSTLKHFRVKMSRYLENDHLAAT